MKQILSTIKRFRRKAYQFSLSSLSFPFFSFPSSIVIQLYSKKKLNQNKKVRNTGSKHSREESKTTNCNRRQLRVIQSSMNISNRPHPAILVKSLPDHDQDVWLLAPLVHHQLRARQLLEYDIPTMDIL